MNFFNTVVTEKANEYVERCLNSTMLSEGELVRAFEDSLEIAFRYRGVAVNSGTAALHLALILSGVGAGDEVILPAQTFVATGLAVLYCGAVPVFADIEKETGNINPLEVYLKSTPRTKAVVCVSWGGNPCKLTELESACKELGIYLIQDNAQALGATYDGLPVSEFGDFSCFSFQSIKHLTTGDGGLLVCKDREKAKRLSWFGISRENDKADFTGERLYNLKEIGYKYHMNDYAAALGLGNMDGILERLRYVEEIASYYDENIPYGVQRDGSSNWLYTLLVDRRDDFIRAMRGRSIPVSVVHVGIDRNTVFSSKSYLPNQRYWDRCHICIPCHSGLRPEDIFDVVRAIKEGW
jgi:perosamine synthetase